MPILPVVPSPSLTVSTTSSTILTPKLPLHTDRALFADILGKTQSGQKAAVSAGAELLGQANQGGTRTLGIQAALPFGSPSSTLSNTATKTPARAKSVSDKKRPLDRFGRQS